MSTKRKTILKMFGPSILIGIASFDRHDEIKRIRKKLYVHFQSRGIPNRNFLKVTNNAEYEIYVSFDAKFDELASMAVLAWANK